VDVPEGGEVKVDHFLVQETLDAIERDPERWSQDSFASACGTTMCFAGWALHLSGYTTSQGIFYDPQGHLIREVEEAARKVLGFDDEQAHQVFFYFPENHLDSPASKEKLFSMLRERVLTVTKEDTEV
jgi:hypothetical protein